MELVEVRSELISNREVLSILKNYTSNKQTNLATIIYETTSYLDSSPASSYTPSQLAAFLDAIHKFELTKIEKIQLVDLKPQNENELHLIVDNIEDRFDESQKEEILKSIETFLSQEPDNTNAKKKKT